MRGVSHKKMQHRTRNLAERASVLYCKNYLGLILKFQQSLLT